MITGFPRWVACVWLLTSGFAWAEPPRAYPRDVTVTRGKVKVVFDLEAEGPVPLWPVASADGGATWNVRTLSATGAVGERVTPGQAKEIVWDSAADYPNGFDMENLRIDIENRAQVVEAILAYKANPKRLGSDRSLAATFDPVRIYQNAQSKESLLRVEERLARIKPLSAQNDGTIRIANADATVTGHRVTVTFDLDAPSPVPLWLIASDDSGASWKVLTASAMGDVGPAVAPGRGKKIEWEATEDYPDGIGIGNIVADLVSDKDLVEAMEEYTRRVRTGDLMKRPFLFIRPSRGPSPVELTDAQVEGSKVYVTYDLRSTRSIPLWLIASADEGRTWAVRTYELEGDVGERVEPGEGKTAIWDTYLEYPEGIEVEGLLLDFTWDEVFCKKMFLYRNVLGKIEGYEEMRYEAEEKLGLAAEKARKSRALTKRAKGINAAASKEIQKGEEQKVPTTEFVIHENLLPTSYGFRTVRTPGVKVNSAAITANQNIDVEARKKAAKKRAKAIEISDNAVAMRSESVKLEEEAEAAVEKADRNIEWLSGELRDRKAEVSIYYGWVGPAPPR